VSKYDHFNLLGPIYDLIFGKKKDGRIVDLAGLKQEQHLLDIGGGTGRVAVLFSEISRNVFLADPAWRMLAEAQKKGITPINTESERLPFCDALFDRIIMVDALHHVRDQEQTIQEMVRMIKPGGRIVIEEPNIHHVFVKLIAIGEKILLMRSHFLSLEKIMALCLSAGDVVVEKVHGKGIVWIIMTKMDQ